MIPLSNLTDTFRPNARSGASVNDTEAATDGNVTSMSERRSLEFTLPSVDAVLWGAAVSGGLLALAAAFIGRRLLLPRRRSVLGFFTKRRRPFAIAHWTRQRRGFA